MRHLSPATSSPDRLDSKEAWAPSRNPADSVIEMTAQADRGPNTQTSTVADTAYCEGWNTERAGDMFSPDDCCASPKDQAALHGVAFAPQD